VYCICCWPLPAQSFSGPSPLGLKAIFYCLSFETSLSIASSGSQGHSICFPPCLHTVKQRELFSLYSLHMDPRRILSSIFGDHRGAAYKLLEEVRYSTVKSRHFLYCRINGCFLRKVTEYFLIILIAVENIVYTKQLLQVRCGEK
jgi:hypothetical protein